MTSFWHPSTNQFLFLVLWHAFSYVCQPSSQSLSNKGLFCNLKPIPTRLCHMIYCCSDKSYPCLVGIGLTSTFCFRVNPIPTKLCHMIYCHRDKSYPCLVGIGLSHLTLSVMYAIWTWNPRGTRSLGAHGFSTCG